MSSANQTRAGRVWRALAHLGFAVLILLICLWSSAAFYVNLPRPMFELAVGAVAVGGLVTLILRFRRRRWGWLGVLAIAVCVGGWYQTLRPSDDRDWSFDVARGVTASVDGDRVTLTDVRNFAWLDAANAEPSWESRTYDITQLSSVDMVTSVWDLPDIAHLLVSFGFDDGQRVVFSVETRKETHENFNILGGFFRQFELVLLAATEDDILKLRTNMRQEDVRLYPVALNETQRRDLFLAYVALAQELKQEPRFYNTITANCTTIVYELAQVIKPGLNLDWRLVLSGHLPSYVEAAGGFPDQMPMSERMERAAITAKALAYDGNDYSAGIRE